MKEKLAGRDLRFIAICLALFAAATWFAAGNFYRAFPEASIDFRVSRDDGRARAERFLAGRAYALAGYRQAASFTYDDDAKTFLEREIGLERANRLMGTRVRLWRWSYRWFRPRQKEEFRADITPTGELAGFSHEIAEDAPRAAVTAAQARSLAEGFLRTQLDRDPASLDFVESSEAARPHRTDRTFTWKERDFNLHDAQNRIEIAMLGGEPGGYREYLKVPEQWTRDYQRLRSKNELAQMIDTAVLVALILGLVVVIVMRVRRGDVRWRGAALVGCIGMALSLCSHANEFPLHEFGYPTTDSYASFLSRDVLQALLGALAAGGLLFVLAAGAEPLYREAFGDQVALGNLFRLRGLRTKRFLLGSILGVTLTAIFIAYQTGFYIVAYRHGAWSPADVPYTDLLNTRFPWLFVLFGGFFPAVSEEFLFRLFAIPFLRKLVRWLPAAVVLAGFIWGFGHAGYPQQPFYIRGVEVGLGGVALGVIMLRFGILPTLVWHYSVDAMYSAMLLLRSHSLYFRLSGAASAGIILLPVVVAVIGYWRRGGFEPHAGLLNGDESAPVEAPVESTAPEAPQAAIGYRPLSTGTRVAAAAILAIGLAALLVPADRFGARPVYKLSAEEARATADAFLRAQSLDPARFRHVTYPASRWEGNDELAGKYFLERRPLAVASSLFERNRTLQRWVTRYYRSLDKEEVFVSVHPETGKVQGFAHTLAEDAPGADLPPDTAIRIAAAFAAAQGWDTAAMDLKENSSEKKKARRDYTLVWEAREGDSRNVDEAHFRLQITVAGDRVASLGSLWKLPEGYERSRSARNLLSILLLALRIAVIALGIVRGVWMTIQNIRRGAVRWGGVMRMAVPTTLLMALSALLSFQLMMQNYRTEIPFETFLAVSYITVLMAAIFGFLMMGGAAALLTSFFPNCTAALRAVNRRVLGADAAVSLAAAIGLGLGLSHLQAVLNNRFHALALFSLSSPELIASAAPAVSAIADAVRSVLFGGAVLAVFVLIAQRLPRRWMQIPLALVAACAILPMDVHTAGEFALHYGFACLTIACGALFCLRIARDNYLAYALVLWVMALRGPLAELFGNGNASLQMQGWMVAAALAAVLIWAIAPAWRRKAGPGAPAILS
jgi:membrane protease YdiL (CAAX protease family)